VTLVAAMAFVSRAAAEPPKGEFEKLVQKSAEVAAATDQAAEKAKPALMDPRRPDERRAWKAELLAADTEVRRLISEGLKSGLRPAEIGQKTGNLAFRELPRDLLIRNRRIGLSDSHLAKGEWLDPKNSVVVAYQEGRTKNGNPIFFFRDSYRSPMQEYMRQTASQYTAVVSPNSVQIDELPVKYTPELGMARLSQGEVETFLGFVDTGDYLPHLAFLHGPGGSERIADFIGYTFDKTQGKWIRQQLNSDQIQGFYETEYHDESSVLVYQAYDFSVPTPPPPPGTGPEPMVAIRGRQPRGTFEFDFKKVLKEIGLKPYPGAP
jgi:hypothetical protein